MNARIVFTFILVAVLPISAGLYYASRIGNVPLVALLAGYVVFVVLAVLILIPLNAWRESQRQRWKKGFRRQWETDIKRLQENLGSQIESCSVTCGRCESRAYPILNSGDKFRCSTCGFEFAGNEHGLIDVDEFKRRHPDPLTIPFLWR